MYSITNVDTSFKNSETPVMMEPIDGFAVTDSEIKVDNKNVKEEIKTVTAVNKNIIAENKTVTSEIKNVTLDKLPVNATRELMFRQNFRPGQQVRTYALEITVNENSFVGRAVLHVILTEETMEDDIILYIDNLQISSVQAGVFSEANAAAAGFNVDGQQLQISPASVASTYFVIIEYTGQFTSSGLGLHMGKYHDE